MSKKKLIPPDTKRCQAIITEGYSFMQIGGVRHPPRQCSNKPDWVAFELQKGKDGQYGSMSVCNECRTQLEKQRPGEVGFKEIEVEPPLKLELTRDEVEYMKMLVRHAVYDKRNVVLYQKFKKALI